MHSTGHLEGPVQNSGCRVDPFTPVQSATALSLSRPDHVSRHVPSKLTGDRLRTSVALQQRQKVAYEPIRAGERDCCDGILPVVKEILYIGREYVAEGVEDFMECQVLNMAEELHDLMEMERAQLDTVRQAKVKAACQDTVEQWEQDSFKECTNEKLEEPRKRPGDGSE